MIKANGVVVGMIVSVVETELIEQQLLSIGRSGPMVHQVVVMVAEVVQRVHRVWSGGWSGRVPIVGMVLRMMIQ